VLHSLIYSIYCTFTTPTVLAPYCSIPPTRLVISDLPSIRPRESHAIGDGSAGSHMQISRTLPLGIQTGVQIDLVHGLDNGDPARTEVALQTISLECVTELCTRSCVHHKLHASAPRVSLGYATMNSGWKNVIVAY
jgi:hypothetical protein